MWFVDSVKSGRGRGGVRASDSRGSPLCALIGRPHWEIGLDARCGVGRWAVMMVDVRGDGRTFIRSGTHPLTDTHTHTHTHTHAHAHAHAQSDVVVCSVKEDELRLDPDCVMSIKRKQSCVQVCSGFCINHCFIKIMCSSYSPSPSPSRSLVLFYVYTVWERERERERERRERERERESSVSLGC